MTSSGLPPSGLPPSGLPPSGLPPSGVAIHREVTAAVAAASAQDPAELRDAGGRLRACDATLVRPVLGALTLSLIEKTFPDGLDGDDLRTLLEAVVRPAGAWLPGLDPHAVAGVLTGALSVHEDDAPAADAEALLIACALVLSHLLHELDLPLGPELRDAFDDLRRAQTMELP